MKVLVTDGASFEEAVSMGKRYGRAYVNGVECRADKAPELLALVKSRAVATQAELECTTRGVLFSKETPEVVVWSKKTAAGLRERFPKASIVSLEERAQAKPPAWASKALALPSLAPSLEGVFRRYLPDEWFKERHRKSSRLTKEERFAIVEALNWYSVGEVEEYSHVGATAIRSCRRVNSPVPESDFAYAAGSEEDALAKECLERYGVPRSGSLVEDAAALLGLTNREAVKKALEVPCMDSFLCALSPELGPRALEFSQSRRAQDFVELAERVCARRRRWRELAREKKEMGFV